MKRLHLQTGQSFFNSPVEQCFYCERHINGPNSWSNLERVTDYFRPSLRGGPTIKIIACHSCQRSKIGLQPEEFIEKLAAASENQQPYKNIDYSQMETIVRNVNYVLTELEKNLDNRQLTIIRKVNQTNPTLIYKALLIPTDNSPSCFYCQSPLDHAGEDHRYRITKDHFRPISKHPRSRLLLLSCPLCNHTKGNDEPEVFLAKIKIAYYHSEDYKKIPFMHLENIIKNLDTKLQDSKQHILGHPALTVIQRYDISLLRRRAFNRSDLAVLACLDDYSLLDLILLCLSLQYRSTLKNLIFEAKFLNIHHFDRLLNLSLTLGWLSTFYSINTIDFSSITSEKMLKQYYILNDYGREIVSLGLTDDLAPNLLL